MNVRKILIPAGFALAGTALAEPTPTPAPRRVDIAVTRAGFEPGSIAVAAKEPVTLVFTRKTDATCAKRVILTLDDGKQLARDLPLDTPVELAVTFPRAAKLTYACSMDMVTGVIVVR